MEEGRQQKDAVLKVNDLGMEKKNYPASPAFLTVVRLHHGTLLSQSSHGVIRVCL